MKDFDRFLLNVVYDIPNFVFVVNTTDGKIIYANQYMRETLGEECVGRLFSEQFCCSGGGYYFASYNRLEVHETPAGRFEFAQQSEYFDDESENWYHVLQRPISWLDGTDKIVFVLNEINPLKQLQKDLSEAHVSLALKNRELEIVAEKLQAVLKEVEKKVEERTMELKLALNRLRESQDQLASSEAKAALSTLIASVSHELKTPIGNGVMTASALENKTREFARKVEAGNLKRSDLAAFVTYATEGTSLMLRNLQRAEELLTHFRQVAADQASEQRREFDLAEVVHEIIATLSPSLKCYPHKVMVEVSPGICMDTQPGPLGQVLINLINNAYLHAFENRTDGVLIIRAEATDDRVHMNVTDNGIGMSEELLAKLFHPFFSTKIGKGGTGLGMAIVDNLVKKNLGGSLQVSSKVGEGTRFDIQLPRILPQ